MATTITMIKVLSSCEKYNNEDNFGEQKLYINEDNNNAPRPHHRQQQQWQQQQTKSQSS